MIFQHLWEKHIYSTLLDVTWKQKHLTTNISEVIKSPILIQRNELNSMDLLNQTSQQLCLFLTEMGHCKSRSGSQQGCSEHILQLQANLFLTTYAFGGVDT